MRIETRRIDDLVPHDRNYRRHPESQLEVLVESLHHHKQPKPIVVTDEGKILAGHGLWEAAKLAGWDDIVCSVYEGDNPDAFLVMDNRSSDMGVDDTEALLALLKDIDADTGLDGTGFIDDDLLALMAEVNEAQHAGKAKKDDEDEDDEESSDDAEGGVEAPTRSKLGDMWQLGRHRLIVGSCTDPLVISRLMDNEKADLIFTDPPYGVSYSGRGQTTKDMTIENDDLDPEQLYQFLLDAFTIFPCRSGANVYICHSDTKYGLRPAFERAMKDAGMVFGSTIIWVKESAGMGWQDYRSQHEPILFGWVPGEGRIKVEDRSQSSIWQVNRESTSGYKHPTQKPSRLAEIAINNSSNPGDVVFDGFVGGGCTLLACESTGRKARCCELEPKYADVVISRWEELTGEQAELISEE